MTERFDTVLCNAEPAERFTALGHCTSSEFFEDITGEDIVNLALAVFVMFAWAETSNKSLEMGQLYIHATHS